MFFQHLTTSISGVFTPRIHSIFNQYKDNDDKLRSHFSELFIKIGRIQFFIIALVISGFYFFGQQFIKFWVGDGYEDSYYIMLLFMFATATPLIQNLGIEIQRALNKHQFRSIILLIAQIGHLFLSIILCQKYDAIGCAFGNFIALLIGPCLIINIFYHKKCFINIFAFWRNIFKMSIGLFIPFVLMFYAKKHIHFDKISIFIAGIIIYTLVYCISMWFCSLNSYEKGLVFRKK